jgi:hypothetical protein
MGRDITHNHNYEGDPANRPVALTNSRQADGFYDARQTSHATVSTDGNNNKEKPTTPSNIDAPITPNQSMRLKKSMNAKVSQ